MAYTPTTWNTGDTITPSALNKIEQGIAEGGGGGYDAEVYIYHSANSADDYDVTIISGTFADLAAKVADNNVPSVLFRIWDDMNSVYVFALGWPYIWDIDGANKYITFHAFQPVGNAGNTGLAYIRWDANDNITL